MAPLRGQVQRSRSPFVDLLRRVFMLHDALVQMGDLLVSLSLSYFASSMVLW